MSKKNQESELDALLGSITPESASQENEQKSYVDENIFDPKPSKAKDGIYRAAIRFIPHIYEGKMASYFSKSTMFLKDVNKENLIVIDTPFGGKGKWNNCPIKTAAWKLHTANNAIDEEKSKQLQPNLNYYALIQVVKDASVPENNGKFFIFRFGALIMKKIEEALKGSEFTNPINVFSPFEAPLFEINLSSIDKTIDGKVRKVATWESCKFTSKNVNIKLEDGTVVDSDNIDSKNSFFEFIKEKSELVNSYRFKEWDEETKEKVKERLDTYFTDAKISTSKTAKTEVLGTSRTAEHPMFKVPDDNPNHKVTDNPDDEYKNVDIDDILNDL